MYDGYPRQEVDLQLQERAKLLSLENEVRRREGALQELQKRLREVEHDHSRWMALHESKAEADLRDRQRLMQEERRYLLELQRIEEQVLQCSRECSGECSHSAVSRR
jgi:hypothetical protein